MASALTLDDRGVLTSCPACGARNRITYPRLESQARCGKCGQPLGHPDAPIDVRSVERFDELVRAASIPIVVDFWAPWCGPCRMVAPELEKVARGAAGRLVLVKVNTDQLPELGERFRVRSIPTLAVFRGGREVGRMAGARPAPAIEAFVAQTLEPGGPESRPL